MLTGLGIRPELFNDVAQNKPNLGFFEAHSENYFGQSIARAKLLELRQDYPISLHGVGLSLGRADHLDRDHLAKLKMLVDEIDPFHVSEHLAWSAYSHTHLPDLLPLPLTAESLRIVCEHVEQFQQLLGRQILVENPSNYLVFDQIEIPEPEFLNELAARTGCGLLLDVNNVHVSATNVGRDPKAYIDALNPKYVKQFHLAGYTEVQREKDGEQETVLIDTHNHPVYPAVWDLFDYTLSRVPTRCCLLEWDSDFPSFEVLLEQCAIADQKMQAQPSADLARSNFADKPKIAKPETAIETAQAPELAEQQHRFLSTLLQLDEALDSAEARYSHRIAVYQNNVFAAIQEYLAEVYPATKGVVGEEFFKQMVVCYLRSKPPRYGDIHFYGDTFHTLCDELPGLKELPYLHDLIRYEWALHRAYAAEDDTPLSAHDYDQAQLLELPVCLRSNIVLIRSNYPIFAIHAQSLPDYEGDVGVELGQSRDTVLVTRCAYRVHSQTLSDSEYQLLNALEKSDTILSAIEVLQSELEPEEISTALGLVLELGLLAVRSDNVHAEASETLSPLES